MARQQTCRQGAIPAIARQEIDWDGIAYEKIRFLRAPLRALRGKVGYYEVGNEVENSVITGGDGNQPTDYDNTNFTKARGGIRGMFAGIKSVDTTAKIVISPGGWLHFGFLDMLWNGTQPDGSSGYPQVRWDVTAWHWYSDMGDITNACGASGCYNVLAYLHTHYNGAPIFVDEYGVRPSFGTEKPDRCVPDGDNAARVDRKCVDLWGESGALYYDQYDDANLGGDGTYGLWQSDGVTPKGRYAGFKAFVAAHPSDLQSSTVASAAWPFRRLGVTPQSAGMCGVRCLSNRKLTRPTA